VRILTSSSLNDKNYTVAQLRTCSDIHWGRYWGKSCKPVWVQLVRERISNNSDAFKHCRFKKIYSYIYDLEYRLLGSVARSCNSGPLRNVWFGEVQL